MSSGFEATAGSSVQLEQVRFRYRGSDFLLEVRELRVEPGEHLAIIGPSGSGKTTLLHLIAGIRLPDSGRVAVDATEISSSGDGTRRDFRIRNIGLVFQEFELLEYLTVLDNILLPFRLSGALPLSREVRERAASLAAEVGIAHRLKQSAGCLSQGEKQRAAVCRALLTRPRLILGDEPTGNLDPANKGLVLEILLRQAREAGATLLVVTHDHELLPRFDRVIDCKRFYAGPPSGSAEAQP